MAVPVPPEMAELRSRAIAEREVAIKQTREKRAKLYGQAFDLIHGLRQFGCHLEHLDGDFPSDDASISRAKFIEASIADAELSHRVLCDELALVDDPDAGTLTLPLSNIFKSSNGSEKDQTPQTANQSQAQVAALSESQAQNTANEHRFKSPALEPQERPFSHYAMDRHSPSFNPHSLPNPTTNFALPPAASTTVDPSNTLTHKVANDAPLRMPDDHYLDRLPPLPANLQRNRVAVGGLLRRKREKDGEKTGSALSGGMELYKSGLLHASLLSVRHLLGTPPDDSNIDPKLRQVRPAKVVMSDDWKVAYRELEMQRALERIEVLKSQSKWSFRQPRKQKGPHVHKTHWDYLLDEMRWMHTDFRQERRWKQAVAFELSTAVLEWHAATPEERKKLCVKTAVLAKEDTHHLEELQQYGSDSTQCDEQDVQKQLLHANEPATENSPLTFPRLVSHRTPLLDQPPSRPVISLSELPLDQQLPLSAKERTAPALLSGLVPDLSVYEPPAPPNSQEEVYRSRRIELCSPLHSRLTPVSALMDSKPLLLSTLNPAQKRKWGTQDEWQDVSNLHPPEKRQTSVPFADAKAGSKLFTPADGVHISPAQTLPSKPPEAPSNADVRERTMDWSESDDVALKGLVDKYGQNWSLVADVFNSETKRVQTDRREGWDMWSRWNSKYGAKAEQSQFTPAAKRQAKKERHHRGMYESMRRAKHRRESLPPRLAPTAPRRINLNAHDTHAVPMPRSTNPRELSRWKCERDAAAAAANENYQRQLIRQQQYMTAQARLQAHHQAVARNQQMIQAQAQQAAGQTRPPSSHSAHSGSQQPNGTSPPPSAEQSPERPSAPTPAA